MKSGLSLLQLQAFTGTQLDWREAHYGTLFQMLFHESSSLLGLVCSRSFLRFSVFGIRPADADDCLVCMLQQRLRAVLLLRSPICFTPSSDLFESPSLIPAR